MNHRLLLAEVLKDTRARNPLFSLRAMAKQLSLSSAHLSQLLSGKRPLTLRVALKIAEKLEMSEMDRANLLELAIHQCRSNSNSRPNFQLRTLRQQDFEPISEWYYFAILSLGKLKTNRASAKWISEQLGISFPEAKEAYEKLKILGYLEEENGKFRQSGKPLHSTRDIPSQAIRKYHKQNLALAKDRIDSVPLELRDYTSITIAAAHKKLPRAKKMIHEFKLKLHQFLDGENADGVYTLAIQLFPITKLDGEISK